MVKDQTLMLRMEQGAKDRIQEAARKCGKTLTTFITEAAQKAARRVESRPTPRSQSSGCPTYFRALCHEAASGGDSGYDLAGHELARHLDSEIPDDLDDEDWQDELAKLRVSIGEPKLENQDDKAVWEWFEGHFPKAMELIPKRRRIRFLWGVYAAAERDLIPW